MIEEGSSATSFEEGFVFDSEEKDLFEQRDSVQGLKEEVGRLKKQVKYLKKMVVLSMFESRQHVKDFFSDIW